MYVFLASSLNVELVYIILKSITKFDFLESKDELNQTILSTKEGIAVTSSKESEDVTLNLNKIKIKNYSAWSQMSANDFTQNDMFSEAQSSIVS